jgi:hypothetical protein
VNLTTQVFEKSMSYTGIELRPHFLLTKMGMKGSAVLGFIGPCEVKTDSMVDWEDRLAQDFIRAKLMLHFLGEFFGISLREGVYLQRIFMAIAGQVIAQETKKTVLRKGDDLFFDGKKLSVSIVTASPVSMLLHVGINIDSEGAPVAATGLKDLNASLDPSMIAQLILSNFEEEVRSVEWACAKVRPMM